MCHYVHRASVSVCLVSVLSVCDFKIFGGHVSHVKIFGVRVCDFKIFCVRVRNFKIFCVSVRDSKYSLQDRYHVFPKFNIKFWPVKFLQNLSFFFCNWIFRRCESCDMNHVVMNRWNSTVMKKMTDREVWVIVSHINR